LLVTSFIRSQLKVKQYFPLDKETLTDKPFLSLKSLPSQESRSKANAGSEAYMLTDEHTPESVPEHMQLSPENEPVRPVSFGDWLVSVIMTEIPVLNLIMLILWSTEQNTNPNKANWAKAKLVVIGIKVILIVFFIGACIGSMAWLADNFNFPGSW
jgi:hypothetical protein